MAVAAVPSSNRTQTPAPTPTPTPTPPANLPATQKNTAVDNAARKIHSLLGDEGFLGTSRNDHMHEIQHTLEGFAPAERNQVVAKLSDTDLKSWTGNINSGGIFGAQGLSHDEKTSLMNEMAGSLDGTQLARLSNAFGNRDDVVALGNSVAKFAAPDTKVDYIKQLAPNATGRESVSDTGFGTVSTLYGDKEAAAIGEVLTSLKGNPQAFNAAMSSLDATQLRSVVSALENERDTTTAGLSPGSASITPSFDPAPLKNLLEAAAASGNVQNKAALFQAASGALSDISSSNTLLTPNPGAKASAALVAQGMTAVMNSDTRGITDRLNTMEVSGRSLKTYLKEVVAEDPTASNGVIGRQLAQLQGAGTGQTAKDYIGTAIPDGKGAPWYRNAQNLGYYSGAIQAAIKSRTSDAKTQGEIVNNIFSTAIAVGTAPVTLAPAGKVGVAVFNGVTREVVRQTVAGIAAGNQDLGGAFSELALPRDPGAPDRYRGAADPFYFSAESKVVNDNS